MTELTGSTGGIFYCPACRHLVRTAEPDFRCFCRGCLNLRRPASQLHAGHAAPTANQGGAGDLQDRRKFL